MRLTQDNARLTSERKAMSAEDTEKDTQQTDETELDNTTATEDGSTEDTAESTEPEYTEHEKKMFERAKKAEAEAKRLKAELAARTTQQTQKQSDAFDLEDVAVLVSQVTNKEDREVVKKYAKLEGKSLEESLNDPIVKGILKERSEMRKTSEVANTAGSRRTQTRVTDEQVVDSFKDGRNFDPEKLAEARMNIKKQAVKR